MTAAAITGYWTGGIIYTPAVGPSVDLEMGVIDANGIDWMLQSVVGADGPATSGQVVQQAGDHGGWATPQYYAPRTLTLTVTAGASSQALRDVARATMQQAVPVSDLALFRLDEPIPKQMYVRRSGPLTETYPDLGSVIFTVGLVAPDPRKYSTALHAITVNQGTIAAGLTTPNTTPFTLPAGFPPMTTVITNAGSFETRPQVLIAGPVTAPAVVNQVTGQTVSFPALTLGSTDVLVVDFLNRQATLNGVYRTADLASSWWVAPPGSTGVQVTGTASSGAYVTVSWRDAWI
jgi:Phage tail protein